MTPQELKQTRISMSKTQSGMAALMCINVRTYQRYESGELKVPAWVIRILDLKAGKQVD